jgi:transmembrane sensor
MDRYNHYIVEDFVWDVFFRQWVLSPTRETDIAWNEWIENNPEKSDIIQQAKSIVLSMRLNEPEISEPEIREVINRTISRIHTHSPEPALGEEVLRRPFYRAMWLQVAASAAFLIISTWIGYSFYNKKESLLTGENTPTEARRDLLLVEKMNTTSSNLLVSLSDGSRITLSPKGRIRYPEQFIGANREVYLEGEAFFEISKDPDHPFFVYANGLITKVLGTSFRIKAYEQSDEVTVEVKTGRVSVFAQSDPDVVEKASNRELEGVVLNPNQKIIYAREEVRMIKTLVEKPEIVLPKTEVPQFEFEDTPVTEAFVSIGKAYGIDILFDEELLKGCPLTATLDNQTLHEKLTIICKAVEASYEILDGQVVIHGKGCRN